MKVRVIEQVPVDFVLFNGKVGMNRSAPLYQSVLVAARDEPGITRTQLGKLFSIPPPWIQRLCGPLLEAKYITETENGIRLTTKGREATSELPVMEQSGDWMAAVLREPVDGIKVITCFEAAPWRIGDKEIMADNLAERLLGESFNAGGEAKMQSHSHTPENDREHVRKLRGGTILAMDDERHSQLGEATAQIATEGDASRLTLNFDTASRAQSMDIRCECKIDLYHKGLDALAAQTIRWANRIYPRSEPSIHATHLLRSFDDMSEAERESALGSAQHDVGGGVTCIVSEVPLYPANKMSYLDWAAWRVARHIDRHLSEAEYDKLVERESTLVAGHVLYGPLTKEAVLNLLRPKQQMYLSAAKDWPAAAR